VLADAGRFVVEHLGDDRFAGGDVGEADLATGHDNTFAKIAEIAKSAKEMRKNCA
jgi:hypothetical protein